jgi:hypothetical protein
VTPLGVIASEAKQSRAAKAAVIASEAKQSRATGETLVEIASSRTQVGLARLGHILMPISGKPEIGALLAMTRWSG